MADYTIANAANVSLNIQTGTIPNLTTAVLDWLQYITFGKVTKTTVAFQEQETITNISFWGTVQPLKPRELQLKPEGQRAWSWFEIIVPAAPNGALVALNVDDVGVWNGIQTRVMARIDLAIYGVTTYQWAQDWSNSGPPTP